MKHQFKLSAVALGLLSLASINAHAQGDAGFVASSMFTTTQSYAGASFGSPLAFGAAWGDAGIGVYGQTVRNAPSGYNGTDGSAAVAVGVGDPDKYVGLEGVAGFSSLRGKGGGGAFGSGGFALKLHTNLPGSAAFAVGVTDIGRFGNSKKTNRSSAYAVATKVFAIGSGANSHPLVVNLGLGDQQFNDLGTHNGGAGVFGSAAFYVVRQVSVIADYTGSFLNLGISAAPIKSLPLTITLGAVNVTNRLGTKVAFAGTLGYAIHF